MSNFDPDFKERVRQALDLIDVARNYMELRSAGRIFKAVCPWHPDTNPSLQFNPERQSYKCWVCGEGGDLFSFVMRIEGVSFGEAVKMLAERAGLDWQAALHGPGGSGSGGDRSERPSGPLKDDLYRAMAWAVREYRRFHVESPAAEEGRRYVEERLLTPESQEAFQVGFAPNEWSWLVGRAQAARVPPAHLEAVGLIMPRQSGNGWIDRFRGRVLFPIRDVQGRAVGLGGRILPSLAAENPAKYINTPETPLFSKSGLLFGLDLARQAVQRARTAVVMEGYTDCIMAHQCGIKHVVAVLGTALTEKHLPLLRRFCDSVILVLDGDDAGKRRANDLVKMFFAGQMDLRVVTLPDDLDPCDFLLERGPEAFTEYLHHAPDALEHKIGLALTGIDPQTDTHRAGEAVEELLGILAAAPRLTEGTTSKHLLREQQVLNRLGVHFGIPEEMLRRRLAELRQPKKPPQRLGEAPPQQAPPPRPAPPPPPNRFVQGPGGGKPGFGGQPGFGGKGNFQGKPGSGGKFDRSGRFPPRDPPAAAPPPSAPPAWPAWETELLELLLVRPDFVAEVEHHPEWQHLVRYEHHALLTQILEIHRGGQVASFDKLMATCDHEALKRLLVDLDEGNRLKSTTPPETRVQALVERLRQMAWEQIVDRTERKMRQQELDPAQQEEALLWLIRRRSAEGSGGSGGTGNSDGTGNSG